MKLKRLLIPLHSFVLAALGLTAALQVTAWLLRPDVSSPPPPYRPEEVAAVEAERHHGIDPDNPLRLHVDVDYGEGEAAAWYPKGQAPILDDLTKPTDMSEAAFRTRLEQRVKSGVMSRPVADLALGAALPPVAERVGPEPCVYRGVDGIGKYGGTWIGGGGASRYWAASSLVRWSPQGYPLVPHVAKSIDVSPDYREYTIALREGMRWSDGHPFTADDIMYWWEHEACDEIVSPTFPPLMMIDGKRGRVERVAASRVRFVFPKPHGLFLPMLATAAGSGITEAPAHYRRPYHPRPGVGDDALIQREMTARRLASARDVYVHIGKDGNPAHPRLWPWLYRTHKPNPPHSLVRNPYFWMVDEAGNQLPYVDRIFCEHVAQGMMANSIAGGRFTEAVSKIRDYTMLMGARDRGNYRVYRWYRADRSDAVIHVNLNRKVAPGDHEAEWKARLLATREFRQALSLALDRREIIEANYYGETEPAQVAPGPASFFHHEAAMKAYTAYDPAEANRRLDVLGLTRRDKEGYRSAPDGTRLTFYLNYWMALNPTTPLFIADHWRRVGIRTIPRVREGRLFYTEKAALLHDFTMWTGENEFLPHLRPRSFLPVSGESNFAIGYARWYAAGGLHGDPRAQTPGCIPVPPNHPLREGLELYERVRQTGDPETQRALFNGILDIAAENTWTIGLCASPQYVVTVKNGFQNVPHNAAKTFTFLFPSNTGLETRFFEDPGHPSGVPDLIRKEMLEVTPEPHSLAGVAQRHEERGWIGRALRWLFLGSGLGLLLMLAVRHPFVGRRILIMIPTLIIISAAVFVIIQMPPGDFLTMRILELKEKGEEADMKQLEDLRQMFHLDDPMPVRYARWLGLYWFRSFDQKDEGLLQGNLGRSMADGSEVNQIVGDRIRLTFMISLGTILFTWAVAVPIGIFSAVRQYSVWDYLLTFIGFIGMCIPSFLLALILFHISDSLFGLQIDRLFSEKYALQPYWDWAKFVDLLKHVWVPVVILGVGGTAGMIRVMRANLLDEVKKPYVVTARAKGVRPVKLLLKYPVRLALNPFISGIGGIFPALISGGALVGIVLSLPTVGPLMLTALLNEDTMVAGSMLMVLSMLGVFGVLVSDLLLLWLDPRIRFQGGGR